MDHGYVRAGIQQRCRCIDCRQCQAGDRTDTSVSLRVRNPPYCLYASVEYRHAVLLLLTNFARPVFGMKMYASIRRIENQVSVIDIHHNRRPACLCTLFVQHEFCVYRRRDSNRFLALLVNERDAMAALGNDSLHIIVVRFSTPKVLIRNGIRHIPGRAKNHRPFRVSFLEGNQHLVADLRPEEEAAVCAGIRSQVAYPGGLSLFLPVVLHLHLALTLRIVNIDDSCRVDAGHAVTSGMRMRTVLGPRGAAEFICIPFCHPAMRYAYDVVLTLAIGNPVYPHALSWR